MSAPGVTPDQAAAELRRLRDLLPQVPDELRPLAQAGLDALDDHAADVALVGTLAVARAWSWAAAIDPFGEPPPRPVGRAAALAELQGAGDRLQDLEDQRREALARLQRLALDVGLKTAQVLVPLLLAGL